jgi:hypothetical protein
VWGVGVIFCFLFEIESIIYLLAWKVSMRNISETFEDQEFNKLLAKKEDMNWHDFIMKLAEEREDDKQPE